MIYCIGDLHFDYSKSKPMDIFSENWENHEEKIMNNWEDKVEEDDLVLIPGDISWALKLEEAYNDLKRINDLPGKKVFVKGNHDYWWQSLKQMNELNLDSLYFIQNTSYRYKNIGIGGTRGWSPRGSEGFDEDSEKVFTREVLRLDMSLGQIDKDVDIKIAMIHYPPFGVNGKPNEFVDIMKKHNIDICIYGHLHGIGHKFAKEGIIDGIRFYCVASDYIDFDPIKILEVKNETYSKENI